MTEEKFGKKQIYAYTSFLPSSHAPTLVDPPKGGSGSSESDLLPVKIVSYAAQGSSLYCSEQ